MIVAYWSTKWLTSLCQIGLGQQTNQNQHKQQHKASDSTAQDSSPANSRIVLQPSWRKWVVRIDIEVFRLAIGFQKVCMFVVLQHRPQYLW